MNEQTIEERVARLERHAGLPMGVKEGEARAREKWRYFMFNNGRMLYRATAIVNDERWHDGGWQRCCDDLSYWLRKVSGGVANELTESEAVARFGREILDDQQEDETPHARALRELDLKPGDRVRVNHVVSRHSGGWKNSWAGAMNDFVGGTHTVRGVYGDTGVGLEPGGYRFPAHALTVVSRAVEGQSEDEKPDSPKTLADVEPHIAVEEAQSDGTSFGYVAWRDDNNNVITYRVNEPQMIFLVRTDRPEDVRVLRVLGPVRVCTEDQAARVKQLEQECERLAAERTEYSRALPDVYAPRILANTIRAVRYLVPPGARRVVDAVADYYSRQDQGGEG